MELIQEDITRVVHLGIYSENRSRPLLISIRTLDRKKVFQNLHQLTRNLPEKVSASHDLTTKEREALHIVYNGKSRVKSQV